MRIRDTHNTYGWISIVLHWLAAAVIFILWFLGDSSGAMDSDVDRINMIRLHVSIAVCAYILLLARIIWRLIAGHPRLAEQSRAEHWVSNTAQYLMLLGIAFMLISGPLTIWSGGHEIQVFDWFSIPSPIREYEILNEISSVVHGVTATLIIIIAMLHICGAFMHLMFRDDDLFIRMLVPKETKSGTDE